MPRKFTGCTDTLYTKVKPINLRASWKMAKQTGNTRAVVIDALIEHARKNPSVLEEALLSAKRKSALVAKKQPRRTV